MKIHRFTLAAVLTAGLAAVASAQSDYYANGTAGSNDNYNGVTANKWTLSSGSPAYVAANATVGNVYHTNGWTLRAGHVGTTTGGGNSFTGGTLLIDDYSTSPNLTSNTTHGGIIFELATSSLQFGPRANPTSYTYGTYTVNVTTAPLTAAMTPGVLTAGNALRVIQGSTGVINLNGTVTLNGDTEFKLPSSINDMRFNFGGPIVGSGRIELSGGSAGGTTGNGYATWAVGDMSGWSGSLITVINKHTLSFTQDTDFFTTNPSAVINFGTTSLGFLNLSADVSFGSGNVFVNGSALADGVYTVDDLNAPFLSLSTGYGATDSSGHKELLASEGTAYALTGTTYKLYIGQSINAAPVPEPSTYAVIFGSLALLGAVVRRRRKN